MPLGVTALVPPTLSSRIIGVTRRNPAWPVVRHGPEEFLGLCKNIISQKTYYAHCWEFVAKHIPDLLHLWRYKQVLQEFLEYKLLTVVSVSSQAHNLLLCPNNYSHFLKLQQVLTGKLEKQGCSECQQKKSKNKLVYQENNESFALFRGNIQMKTRIFFAYFNFMVDLLIIV